MGTGSREKMERNMAYYPVGVKSCMVLFATKGMETLLASCEKSAKDLQ